MKYLKDSGLKTFEAKPKQVQDLIEVAIFILDTFGMPVADFKPRRLERMAISFLAVADAKKLTDLKSVKHIEDGRSLKTRDVINYVNEYFAEEISSGSYDDIRRKDLRLLVLGGIVVQTSPNSARNDSTRGYALSPFYARLVQAFDANNPDGWREVVSGKLVGEELVREKLKAKRDIKTVPVKLPSGEVLQFSAGEHNDLQKAIIEEFLPRYGYGAELLYVGDTADKFLFLNEEKLKELKFFELAHGELPDVVAYSEEKNWLYLIEAVHSSGPISAVRLSELQKLAKDCTAGIVYVTAFLDRVTFRKFLADIAWETEVWIAKDADHLIHFNGDKFMGPYSG